jgi:hypothetical protein
METKLNEAISKLANLELIKREIAKERSDFEDMIQDKEIDNNYDIYCTNLEIRKLQNEIGSNIILTKLNEKLLRKHLKIIENMIYTRDTDESSINLLFEVPNKDDLPYSIHINIDNYYIDRLTGGLDDPKVEIIIKTRCTEVERIVRETITEYDNMRNDFEGKDEEKLKDFEMNFRRKWTRSFHMDTHIKFMHKEDTPDQDT